MADEQNQVKQSEKAEKKPTQIEVRILRSIGTYEHGKSYFVSPQEAEKICTVRERHNGAELEKFRCAIPVAELESLRKKAVDEGGLTLDELRELGYKGNVVKTPTDKAFEERLKNIQENQPAVEEIKDEAGMASAKALNDAKRSKERKKFQEKQETA